MKIAVITGASSGMGREFVYAVDREFELDEIWVFARREGRLSELGDRCRTRIRCFARDLSDPAVYEEYRALLEAEKPELHVLVNAAGYGLFGVFEEMGLQEQLGIADLNDKALTAMCLLSLPYMKKGDHIINMGSNSCWQPVPFQAVYGASKAYVLSFSRAIGRELKPRGIHVMCVCPGWIKTEFMDRAVHDDTISYYDRWYTAEEVIV
ncbi:MAG: SDR family NAD(P)-dependent oxidoreductase, partial [Oscillospiraceae bacterium]|nr:SDR family NAD(P)-dependent oxidoreductase [Oscillospiraceae bacterium]